MDTKISTPIDKETAKNTETPYGAPAVSVPKGGGAIRGIGEKFAANPVTGTGSMTVPIATSPGRAGFGPQLSLAYDSGAGNGPFGLGWNLSIPSITRKTDKGLPQYRDADESDVFVLSGAEDLVPEFKQDVHGTWVMQDGKYVIFDEPGTVGGAAYRVRRYRPRVEGLFARIERWTNVATAEIHWRSITRDNVTTLYGKDSNSLIFDPTDPTPNHPQRIFSWLICASYDDKGNAVVYRYANENSDNVPPGLANERNRHETIRSANRYLKRILYGNRTPNRGADGRATDPALLDDADWMFEVVFDYGEGHYDEQAADGGQQILATARVKSSLAAMWPVRLDPFSSYRAGFEVRSYRLCRRVLMFHHFPQELGVADCLVGSTELHYDESPIASFITSMTQSGFVRRVTPDQPDRYLKKSLPPLEFEYSQTSIQDEIRELDGQSLENLPRGVDGAEYQFVDLDGEGLSSILCEQGDAWFYKRNWSPLNVVEGNGSQRTEAKFAPMQVVGAKPAASLAAGHTQFMDLAGDGQLDLVQLDGPVRGFYERVTKARQSSEEGADTQRPLSRGFRVFASGLNVEDTWESFRPFESCPNVDTRDPNLRFVDLNGDGHADILITGDDVLNWYPSLAEKGFGPAAQVYKAIDEEKGPRLVFDDGTQSIYLADMSGDGLVDLVRITNSGVCYWPNLGYGRFGAKVTMDTPPQCVFFDEFDQRRIRLGDIDGSGTTDVFYFDDGGVTVWWNQSGNSWSRPERLNSVPPVHSLDSYATTDLLGNGTACLVWSSPLPADGCRPLWYVDLMGGSKPHLLVAVKNNLGAETCIRYAPSTRFYLEDERDGRPWATRLPFPVHVVEQVETWDHVSRNRFITRYAYHHGYFDGEEREFRGFSMVEQWDTGEFAALGATDQLPQTTNEEPASHVPPLHTKTWFHTGAFREGIEISRHLAHEYYGAPKHRHVDPPWDDDPKFEAFFRTLLDDTVLPHDISMLDGQRQRYDLIADEVRQACRALKGLILRQEVYADDGSPKQSIPYSVAERNYTLELLQPQGGNRHAVFFAHPRENLSYHHERNLEDPRIQHELVLEVGVFGNVLKSAAVEYGRKQSDLTEEWDQQRQQRTLITYSENDFTNPIGDRQQYPDDYRAPLPCESRTYELTGFKANPGADRFRFDQWSPNGLATQAMEVLYEQTADNVSKQKRLIEHVRTLYRRDDLTEFLSLGKVGPQALPGASFKLAFTPGLLAQVFQRDGQPLLSDPTTVLAGQGADRGGYVVSQDLKATGVFPVTDPDDRWWIPSGRVFFDPATDAANPALTAAAERAVAKGSFFLPRKFTDPFGHSSTVDYDSHKLLIVKIEDAVGNRVAAINDYRVLQPREVVDPNGNHSEVTFDVLGMVAGTAIKGKVTAAAASESGDVLAAFDADLTQTQIDAFFSAADPHALAEGLLGNATTRIIYDLNVFGTTRNDHPNDPTQWQPAWAATLARETHAGAPLAPEGLKIQISFSYSDGFGREIQKKIQAEPGPLVEGGPVVSPRWVGSGWTIFNNKGKPVRQYEPFFSTMANRRHRFEFARKEGVSPILCYDPLDRVVATMHPNHTWEKVVFDPWRQETWDVNDTVRFVDPETHQLVTDPTRDPDVAAFFERLPATNYLPTWYALRTDPLHAAQVNERWPDPKIRDAERAAAHKAAVHAGTSTVAHFDTLGRPFLTIAHNRFERIKPDGSIETINEKYATRVELDIEGNQRAVRDAVVQNNDKLGRVVMRYDYDMLGNRIHQSSMEAGQRWTLADVAGNPIRAWDTRGHTFRTTYDALRRPLRSFVKGHAAAQPDQEILFQRTAYGERHPDSQPTPAGGAAPLKLNLRGRVFLQLDSAGVVVSAATNPLNGQVEAYDFKGNPRRAQRQLARDYKNAVDWSGLEPQFDAPVLDVAAINSALAPLVEPETFQSRTIYDALNRPTQLIAPHSDQPGTRVNVIQPIYNEANLLEQVHAWLNQNAEPVDWLNPVTANLHAVTDIDYDAKGQRTLIDYATRDGNLISTSYAYDRETFRLTHLYTRRGVDPLTRHGVAFTDDSDNPQPPPPTTAAPENPPQGKSCGLQNLFYTYDPAGNITHIRDDAQQTIYFNGQVVPPQCDYTYDAIYRLIEATSREHIGQLAQPQSSWNDEFRVNLRQPGDSQAMRNYTEQYLYDAVGNFEKLIHQAANGTWTRAYAHNEASLIEPAKQSNRLSSTTIGTTTEPYTYEAHGNMTGMPHLTLMQWEFKDQLSATSRQAVNPIPPPGNVPETTYYVYDTGGQRVRKVTARKNGSRKAERIYLGGFEIYREYQGNGVDIALERETLHIMDDKHRIALVETRTQGSDGSPARLIRYQFGNHLGSASLELDDQGSVISYEEYTPYGSTSYQAVDQSVKAAKKRYRYTGKERDEETGLTYHGARYYPPWLGRWTSCDPTELADGSNVYTYVSGNPVMLHDPNGHAGEPSDPIPAYRLVRMLIREGAGAWKTPEELTTLKYKLAKLSGLEPADAGKLHWGHPPDSPRALTQAGREIYVRLERKAGNLSEGAKEIRGLVKKVVKGEASGIHNADNPGFTRVGGKDLGAPPGAKQSPSLVEKTVEGGEEAAKKLTTGTKEGVTVASKQGATVAAKDAATVAAKGLVKEEAQVGLKAAVKLGGTKVAKFLPGVGVAVGLVLIAKDLQAGDHGAAAWDAAEAVPIAGDIVGLGHLSLLAGSSDVAAEHGKAVADAETRVLTWVGVNPEQARRYADVSGGFVAATSAVSVAPFIAANRKLQDAGKAIGDWIKK